MKHFELYSLFMANLHCKMVILATKLRKVVTDRVSQLSALEWARELIDPQDCSFHYILSPDASFLKGHQSVFSFKEETSRRKLWISIGMFQGSPRQRPGNRPCCLHEASGLNTNIQVEMYLSKRFPSSCDTSSCQC